MLENVVTVGLTNKGEDDVLTFLEDAEIEYDVMGFVPYQHRWLDGWKRNTINLAFFLKNKKDVSFLKEYLSHF